MHRIVTVYTAPHCQQCIATKRWLDKNNVEYSTVDISQSHDDVAPVETMVTRKPR